MSVHASARSLNCVLHGSFHKHLARISDIICLFQGAGINVLEPKTTEVVADRGGFVFLRGQEHLDPREIEADYLSIVLSLRGNGFSYFVNPGGYVGPSASHELGIVMARGIPFFFSEPPSGHCFFVPQARVVGPEALAEFISDNGTLPNVVLRPDEIEIAKSWMKMFPS